MKNTAINTLKYTGIVTLSQYIGSKKIRVAQGHNTGGTSLFNFLASCLAGNFSYAETNWPTKIKVLSRTEVVGDENTFNYSSASGFIFLRTAPEILASSSGDCRVRYSFTVPRDIVEYLNNNGTLGLGLYTNNAAEDEPDKFAAFCELNISNGSLVNSALLVDWELKITNS